MSDIELSKLNSATKYPSILTYHVLDPEQKGRLTDRLYCSVEESDLILTEKVDGTNGRIVLMPGGDYVIGSREELLYAKGDRIGNPAQGIVEALKPLAERLSKEMPVLAVTTLYLEVYGGKIGANAKQYTGNGRIGYRLFDVLTVPEVVFEWDRPRISDWRETASAEWWWPESDLQTLSEAYSVLLTPRMGCTQSDLFPRDVEGAYKFMKFYVPKTWVDLDGGAGGRPEGLVIRTRDRSFIAKMRFQDYERTLKRQSTGKRK